MEDGWYIQRGEGGVSTDKDSEGARGQIGQGNLKIEIKISINMKIKIEIKLRMKSEPMGRWAKGTN